MKNYKVIITCGAYYAPCIYVTAIDNKGAENQARYLSGLSKFKQWIFIPTMY